MIILRLGSGDTHRDWLGISLLNMSIEASNMKKVTPDIRIKTYFIAFCKQNRGICIRRNLSDRIYQIISQIAVDIEDPLAIHIYTEFIKESAFLRPGYFQATYHRVAYWLGTSSRDTCLCEKTSSIFDWLIHIDISIPNDFRKTLERWP